MEIGRPPRSLILGDGGPRSGGGAEARASSGDCTLGTCTNTTTSEPEGGPGRGTAGPAPPPALAEEKSREWGEPLEAANAASTSAAVAPGPALAVEAEQRGGKWAKQVRKLGMDTSRKKKKNDLLHASTGTLLDARARSPRSPCTLSQGSPRVHGNVGIGGRGFKVRPEHRLCRNEAPLWGGGRVDRRRLLRHRSWKAFDSCC